MDNFDWIQAAISAVITYAAIQYGMWLQRRADRKAAQRAQERRLAAALAQVTLRGRDRG